MLKLNKYIKTSLYKVNSNYTYIPIYKGCLNDKCECNNFECRNINGYILKQNGRNN